MNLNLHFCAVVQTQIPILWRKYLLHKKQEEGRSYLIFTNKSIPKGEQVSRKAGIL